MLLEKNEVEYYYKIERMEIRCFLLNLKCIIDKMDKSIWIILLYALTNNGCNFNSIRSYYINTEKSFVIFINPCKIILLINIKNRYLHVEMLFDRDCSRLLQIEGNLHNSIENETIFNTSPWDIPKEWMIDWVKRVINPPPSISN